MAKIAEVQEVSISLLKPYERNAKIHSDYQIEKLKESIKEFGFISPCLIDREYNIIAGHGRLSAALELGMSTIPCVFVEGLTEAQRRAYTLADNRLGELGEWNMDIVNDELLDLDELDFDIDLTGFEMPKGDWFAHRERWDMSREEDNEEYNEFLEKFEAKKTTDDCYTPDNIYEVVAEYVETKYGKNRANFVRPFFPNGDYQAETYKPDSVVVDNPPFSILASIVDFYAEREIPFFLFAPGLSTVGYVNRNNVCAICAYAPITYENGATVLTSFLTNMEEEGVAALSDPELYKALDTQNEINLEKLHRHLPRYEYPAEVATAAGLGQLSKYGQAFKILRTESLFIRALDSQKEKDKAIYGGGFLLSEKAAAEKAAAEKTAAEKAAAEKATAEKAAAHVWELSEREKKIVRTLGKESVNG